MNNLFVSAGSDDAPADFTEYLGQRLNVAIDDVLPLLGRCLVEYQAQRDYDIRVLRVNDAG